MKQTIKVGKSKHLVLFSLLHFFAVVLILAGGVAAQEQEDKCNPSEVKLGPAFTSVDKVAKGSTVMGAVSLDLPPGCFISANKNFIDKDYLLTKLDLAPPTGITVDKIYYPKGEPDFVVFDGGKMHQRVHGRAVFIFSIKVSPSFKTGNTVINGNLKFYIVSDMHSFRPRELKVSLPLNIVSDKNSAKEQYTDIFQGQTAKYYPLSAQKLIELLDTTKFERPMIVVWNAGSGCRPCFDSVTFMAKQYNEYKDYVNFLFLNSHGYGDDLEEVFIKQGLDVPIFVEAGRQTIDSKTFLRYLRPGTIRDIEALPGFILLRRFEPPKLVTGFGADAATEIENFLKRSRK